MVHCVSQSCREELDQKWNFCPFCGTDNRPPEYRPRIRNCRHEYVGAKGYCVDCGKSYGSGMATDSWRLRWGLAGVVSGVLVLVATFLIWQIHNQGHGPGYDWIRSWYDETYMSRTRYGSSYMQYRGNDVIAYMTMIGAVLFFAGITAFTSNSRVGSVSSRRTNDWDD